MTDQSPWAIVGLGNPGEKYARTRHNIGAMVVSQLAERSSERFRSQRRARCDVAEARLSQTKVVLAIPMSYMNESGGPVSSLLDYFSVPTDHLIVVHDEIDLPFAGLRLKFGGGDNGHNGLKSIRRSLGHGDWYRIRVGVGRGRGDTAGHVLSGFSGAERKELPALLDRAAESAESLISDGLATAQNHFNQ